MVSPLKDKYTVMAEDDEQVKHDDIETQIQSAIQPEVIQDDLALPHYYELDDL